MGVRVQISARLIRWPQMCACCLGRADDVYKTTHARVTGKKVIRTDSRWWKVPYCSDCLDHMDAEARAKSITAAGAYAVLVGGILLGLMVALCGPCCGPALFTPAQPKAGNQRAAQAGVVVVMIGSVVAGVGVGVGAFLWYQRVVSAVGSRRAAPPAPSNAACGVTCVEGVLYLGCGGDLRGMVRKCAYILVCQRQIR